MEAYERPEHYNFWEWFSEYRIPIVAVGALIVAIIVFMLLPGARAVADWL